MQAKFQIKFLSYCGKKYGAPDLVNITFYVNKSQVYSKHLKILMTSGTNKPKKKESVQDSIIFYKLFRDDGQCKICLASHNCTFSFSLTVVLTFFFIVTSAT